MKASIRPFTKNFYRKNRWCLILAVMETLFMTASNMMISWLIQQIIDLTTGVSIGFTFFEVFLLSLRCMVLFVCASGFSYLSRPRFVAKAMAQY